MSSLVLLDQIQPFLDAYSDDVFVLDPKGIIVKANENFAIRSGKSLQRIEGKAVFLKTVTLREEVSAQLAPGAGQDSETFVTDWRIEGGEPLPCQISILKNWLEKGYILVLVKDMAHEHELHSKYRGQMMERDRKIHELNLMVKLLSVTRLARDHQELLGRFSKYLSDNLGLSTVWFYEGNRVLRRQRLADKEVETTSPPSPDQWVADIPVQVKTIGVDSWLLVVVRSKNVPLYRLAFQIPPASLEIVNVELITALAEQIELQMENTDLEKISSIDDLTQVRNSRSFRFKFDEYAEKYNQLHLALMDVDFFKKVNDTYGHAGGDAVLRVFGRVLQDFQIEEQVVARVGGEEFAFLLPELSADEVAVTLEKLRAKFEATVVPFENREIRFTISIGYAQWDRKSMRVGDLYKAADAALYMSKTGGRNRVTRSQGKT